MLLLSCGEHGLEIDGGAPIGRVRSPSGRPRCRRPPRCAGCTSRGAGTRPRRPARRTRTDRWRRRASRGQSAARRQRPRAHSAAVRWSATTSRRSGAAAGRGRPTRYRGLQPSEGVAREHGPQLPDPSQHGRSRLHSLGSASAPASRAGRRFTCTPSTGRGRASCRSRRRLPSPLRRGHRLHATTTRPCRRQRRSAARPRAATASPAGRGAARRGAPGRSDPWGWALHRSTSSVS